MASAESVPFVLDEKSVAEYEPATSSTNYNSPLLTIQGQYYTSSVSSADSWNIQDIVGTGSSPSSTLKFTHSGSSGTATMSVPTLSVTGTLTTGNITESSSGVNSFTVTGTGTINNALTVLEPSLATGNSVAFQIGTSDSSSNDSTILSFSKNGGTGSTSNYGSLAIHGASGVAVYGTGHVAIGGFTDCGSNLCVIGSMAITGTLTTGNITESSGGTNSFTVTGTATTNNALVMLEPSLATGLYSVGVEVGVAQNSNYNSVLVDFVNAGGLGSTSNYAGFGLLGALQLDVFGTGDVAIGSATDCGQKLCVNGEISLATLAAATSNTLCYNTSVVSGYDTLSTCSSLRKYKDNIQPLTGGIAEVMQLSPVSYLSKTSGREEIGFIAEDMEKIDGRNATYDEKGKLVGVQYDHMTALLTEAVQEQQHEIDELKREIRESKSSKMTLTQ